MSRLEPALLLPGTALAAAPAHTDPVADLTLRLALVLVAAKLGGHLAARLKQPSVLGELLAGVALGNLDLMGIPSIEPLQHDPALDLLARLGILLLLFEVGLESTVAQMFQVGLSSFLVALVGVTAPFVLGAAASSLLLPQQSMHTHIFVGATLTATSVGITARVLQDLGCAQHREARIILGAAVIDDVLGLVLLAVVTGAIAAAAHGGNLEATHIALILGKALVFLVAALVLGVYLAPRVMHLASRLQASGVLLAVGLSLCFLLSAMADRMGLAPIVGAFAAGLVLEDVHYRDFKSKGEHGLEELVRPISSFLVPVFFVLMGMHTDLRVFADRSVLWLAGVLTAVAIVGKLASGLGARGQGLDRLSIGFAMVPRGEVGLIFIDTGAKLTVGGQPLIVPALYSSVIIMVILTTLCTPPALGWSLRRRGLVTEQRGR
ncbi:MAG: cation:proton antiporter [Myxococcales bacterium]|nr:cation:proton antiporter [Myxococcota bacterium]MDW8281618.1 cation:proton antiporter [Myxococcales bacterium]